MIAYCGLICDTCPIHLATIEPDESRRHTMRVSIAEQCTNYYGLNFRPEDITDCDGCCSATGRMFSGCSKCEIRKCAILRAIENCAFCEDYACDKLKAHFALDPGAQHRLEEIRNRLVS
jgi:hypothetical protein